MQMEVTMLLKWCLDRELRVLKVSLCVSDMEESLTLTLQGAVARNICIAFAGRGDLELMVTWRVELGCMTLDPCSICV